MKVVFVGPSLPDAKTFLHGDIKLLPPAKCGDVHLAALNGASQIGLIDGTFESGMSVWHKEIIYALDRGIAVAGSSSMGALRAAECARYGMKGFGTIFEDYHRGKRTQDADVALTFAPQELGFQPLSITMVDLEATIASLSQSKKFDTSTSLKLVQTARQIYFKFRTLESLLKETFGQVDNAIFKLLKDNWIDQKRLDALELVKWINSV
jgi:hypothetical protein